MLTYFSFIFTMGGILGFLAMLVHSKYIGLDNKEISFIFGGGVVLAWGLEATLIHIFEAYEYTNLPLNILDVPVVIPLGWVITFYGISTIAQDMLEMLQQKDTIVKSTVLSGFIALLFGLGIEVLARNLEFWVFHFEALEIGGVPVVVTLAWGLSVAAFVAGIKMYKNHPKYWIVIILGVQIVNTLIAGILIQFTSLAN